MNSQLKTLALLCLFTHLYALSMDLDTTGGEYSSELTNSSRSESDDDSVIDDESSNNIIMDRRYTQPQTAYRNKLLALRLNEYREEQSTDPNLTLKNKKLLQGIKEQNLKTIICAITEGADVNSRDVPLLNLIEDILTEGTLNEKTTQIVKCLLALNADIFKPNHVNNTPFLFAFICGRFIPDLAIPLYKSALARLSNCSKSESIRITSCIIEVLNELLKRKNNKESIKLFLYLIRDISPAGYASLRATVRLEKRYVRYSDNTGEWAMVPITRDFMTAHLDPSLQKYFEIKPTNMEEYLKNPCDYKTNNEDEFDPVKKYPEEFNKEREILDRWELKTLIPRKECNSVINYIHNREMNGKH